MFGSRKAKKKIERLIKDRPKYTIQEEAFQNQAIARGEAYGRDRAIQGQEQALEQDTADAVGAAKDVTAGTSGLLSTIAAINANKDATRRDLATTEAQLATQKKSQLLNVNNQMIDEKDKAWNYNVNDPYQLKVAQQREKLKRAQMIGDSFSGVAIAVGSNAATSGNYTSQGQGQQQDSGNGQGGLFGMLGGIFSDERLKKNVFASEYGVEEVMKLRPVEYQYTWEERKHLGFIAQEVEKVIPEIITVNEDTSQEYLKISLQEMIPVLVKAVQEQQLQIQSLKEEIESLKVTE